MYRSAVSGGRCCRKGERSPAPACSIRRACLVVAAHPPGSGSARPSTGHPCWHCDAPRRSCVASSSASVRGYPSTGQAPRSRLTASQGRFSRAGAPIFAGGPDPCRFGVRAGSRRAVLEPLTALRVAARGAHHSGRGGRLPMLGANLTRQEVSAPSPAWPSHAHGPRLPSRSPGVSGWRPLAGPPYLARRRNGLRGRRRPSPASPPCRREIPFQSGRLSHSCTPVLPCWFAATLRWGGPFGPLRSARDDARDPSASRAVAG